MKSNRLILILFTIIVIIIIHHIIIASQKSAEEKQRIINFHAQRKKDTVWRGANHSQIPYYSNSGKLILYGYKLIANTSFYLGPKGTVAHISNGMNCQNCHLDGGTLPWANNFGKVYSTYPLFYARSNSIESINNRINDCFERSMNGLALDSNCREMKAIYAYIKWLGKDVAKGDTLGGTTIMKLKYMTVAADTLKGKEVYMNTCSSCHANDGQGKLNNDGTGYIYPPLWGGHSYNDGAGMYRLSSFASFVKNNMPFGTDYHNPKLTDEEAWNVAAFINSQPRPHKDQSKDWTDIKRKPIDFPFGPYNDTFSETQHKFGPFKPIQDAHKQTAGNNQNFSNHKIHV